MNKLTKLLLVISIGVIQLQLSAQDIHFSQFYETPLSINPALTGHIAGTYRVGVIYRNQWSSALKSNAYNTPSLSADFNLFNNKLKKGSLGLGFYFMNDQSGGNKINNVTSLFSLSYHMPVDKKEKHYLSLGFQSGIIKKQFSSKDFIYTSQFDKYGNIDPNLQGEILNGEQFINPDVRVGLLFSSFLNEEVNLRIGVTYLHLLNTNESIFNTISNLPSRLISHGALDVKLKNKVSIKPNLLVMLQAKVIQFNGGLNLSYHVNDEVECYIGGAYRNRDAAILIFGMEYKKMRIGGSYDFTVSDLRQAANGNGAFEISLTYIGGGKDNTSPILPAIRFY